MFSSLKNTSWAVAPEQRTSDLDEATLIDASLYGDLNAFNQLVLSYQNLMYSHAYRIMGESQAAEDAVQETFIIAYRKLSSYRGGSFKGWLLRIVTNLCLDELRREKRRKWQPLEPIGPDGEEFDSPDWMIDPGQTPEEAAERQDMHQALQESLEQLNPDFRTVVSLVDLQGLEYAETAAILGISIGTVKSRLARSRAQMRRYILEHSAAFDPLIAAAS